MAREPDLELPAFFFCPREHLFPCNALDTSSLLPLVPHNELSLLHRKLYFAQSHKPPYHGRVCVAPPGCLLSSSPDGPTKGILYVPSEKGKLMRTCSAMSVRSREPDPFLLPSDVTNLSSVFDSSTQSKAVSHLWI